ncbi:CDP-alcohol phosphatidyltransferase family protein [Halomonas huangheensis]|uniref:CDP-alcohol phosphatidyltransferase n=1 Tax=Halomonas huangheensis TaxID=1178482 RepID=W1N811_9GAMM|nr:CDP-alcohol phosphatidyltransferase family protein [Halomonas huangheensis]ALM53330.1 hypothetical protein AR456_14380 [Halomonas huangheensis]ERL51649.1 hypothetical protein BJB45_12735 [Halomonas huangheensis]
MPSIYQLKPAFQARLRPLVKRIADAGISANQITLAAMLLSLVAGLLLVIWPNDQWPLWLVPVVLFVRMALNAIDGMLAREHDMQSRLGAILNELGDVFSDAALYLPFALLAPLSPMAVVLVVLLATISEMTGVLSQALGGTRRYDGPMGKSDRAVLFGALALWVALGGQPTWLMNAALAVACVLLAWTIINRAIGALREEAE